MGEDLPLLTIKEVQWIFLIYVPGTVEDE